MDNSILTGLTLGITVIISMLLSIYIAYRVIRAKISRTITDFVTSPAVGTPSPFAVIVNTIAKEAGRAIAVEAKTTLMGKLSVQSKQESAIMGDIAQDQLSSQMPLMSGLLDTMPTLKKRLLKNPGLLASLAGVFQSSGVGGNGNHSIGSTGSSSVAKFNL